MILEPGAGLSAAGEPKLELQRVARLNINSKQSEFYPPRARWYGAIFEPWFKVRRGLHLEAIQLPVGFTSLQFILSLIVPGYSFFVSGSRILGWTFLGTYFLAALTFVIALGYQLGGIGFGLMISAHASSLIFLERHWLRDQCRFGIRFMLACLTLLAVWLAVYSPLTSFAEEHFIIPLRVRGNVVIVHRFAARGRIKRGDWIMYSLREHFVGDAHGEGGAVMVRDGFNWGPVLAMAGDRVEFSTNAFAINGIERPRLPHMPASGGFVVPEKHWFVWPELDITSHGNVGEARVSNMMLQLGNVSEIDLIGKPFKYWFFRRQI